MLVNIKHLDKHKLFAALYNHTRGGKVGTRGKGKFDYYGHIYGHVNLDEAKAVINTFKPDFSNVGPLYFDYFDAKKFLKSGDGRGFNASPMEIDLSYSVTDTGRYDYFYGEGKAEELINELRKEQIEVFNKLMHDETTPLPAYLSNAHELMDAIKELRVEVQNYERMNQEQKKEATVSVSSSSAALFSSVENKGEQVRQESKAPTSQSKNAKSSSGCRLM